MEKAVAFFGFISRYGGDQYSAELAARLAENLKVIEYRVVRSQGLNTILNFSKLIFYGNSVVRDVVIRPFSMPIYRRNMVVIFHHYDPSETPFVPRVIEFIDLLLLRFFNKIFDVKILAVSKYWEEWLRSKGFTNVVVLYNEVDVPVATRVSRHFLAQKYDFDIGKKWIFLGAANTKKGGQEILRAATPSDFERFEFIASGHREDDLKKNFNSAKIRWIDKDDYFSFLFECEWVVANSRLREGWCRVVIEASLSGSAVVGTGVAGMSEALNGVGGLTSASPEQTLQIVRSQGESNREKSEVFCKHLREKNSSTLKFILTTWL